MPAQVTFAGTQVVVAGGPAFTLAEPESVAVDGSGNVYIADRGNDRILMVSSSGSGYSTPTVILSNLSNPSAVASDWTGNIFVANTGSNSVVMMPRSTEGFGAPTVIASGFSMPAGVAVDWADNVYVADTGNNRVLEIPYVGGVYGSPVIVSTGFNQPTEISVDSRKTLYIADTGNNHIIKEPLTSNGYTTKQILGVGTTAPMGVAVDTGFDMYVADTGNGRVLESTWNAGGRFNKSSIVGGNFGAPSGMVADGSGGVYVADSAANRVVDLVPSSVNFSTVSVGAPASLQTYQFEVYAGTTLGSVGVYTQGVAGRDFNDAGGSSCAAGTYNVSTLCVVNVAFTPLGSGQRNGAIVLFDPSGNALATAFISGVGAEPQAAFFPGTVTYLGTGLSGPAGVAVDGNGNVFIADTGNDRVVEVASSGGVYGEQTLVLEQGLSSPMGLAIDGADSLYIVSNGNDKVVKLPWLGDAYGTPTKVGTGLYGPMYVAVDGVGNVYITDTLDGKIWKVAWTGSAYAAEQKLGDYVHYPVGIAVDVAGDVYFTSPYQNNLALLPMQGGQYQRQVNRTLQGTSFPSAIVTDGNSNLYILDTTNNNVVMLPWTGTGYGAQTTVASGFNAPSALAIDANGNLYVADTGNNQVVKIDFSAPSPLNFGSVYEGSSSSKPLTTIVENIGNEPLNLTAVSYPLDFPQYQAGNKNCAPGTSIGQGISCTLSANFTPLSANPQMVESVSVTDNTLNVAGATQSIVMNGAGTGELSQTLTFPAISDTVYGSPAIPLNASASSGLTVSYQVLSGPAAIGLSQYPVLTLVITGAGTVVVKATQAGSASYQAATPITLSFTVSPAMLTVTPLSVQSTYGSVPTSFRTTITGFVFGQSAGQVITGAALVTSTASSLSGIGTYNMNASTGSLTAANYAFAFAPGTLTVNPATLTISGVSVSNSYGKPLPSLAWTMAGLKNGDSANVVTGTPLIATSANSGSMVGTYPIQLSQGSLASSNYIFQFNSGTLTVQPAILTVTANTQTAVYGLAVPSLTYSIAGFVQGDTQQDVMNGTPVISTTGKLGSAAGTYVISLGMGTLNSTKYKFTLVSGSLIVQKATLQVVPVNAAAVYGQPTPPLTYTINGMVNGDTARVVSGRPALTACASKCIAVGTYTIQSGSGSLIAANYTFSFGQGTLTVNPATLTISGTSASNTYGQPMPSLAWTMTGLKNGDSANVVTGTPLIATSANSGSMVGTYPIQLSQGSLASSNYIFQFNSGTLTVQPAILTVTANTQTAVYGLAVPSLTYSIAGFVQGDTQQDVMNGIPVISTAGKLGSAAGTYVISLGMGTLNSTKYKFTLVSGSLIVQKATLRVVPVNAAAVYGQPTPSLTYTINGLVNGDAARVVSGRPALTGCASKCIAVGTYTIQAGMGSLAAANYTFGFGQGTLTVNPATLTISGTSASNTYGQPMPSLTWTMAGLENGDSANVVAGAPLIKTSATSNSPVGSYPIQLAQGSLSASNYVFQFSAATLTVQPALLMVTANNQSMVYGLPMPSLTYTITGFMPGDSQGTSLKGTPAIVTTAKPGSPAGSYAISPGAGTLSSANYKLAFVNGSLLVKKATLLISPLSLSIVYGKPMPSLTYTISGLVNGDTARVISGQPALTACVSKCVAVGTYTAQAQLGSLASVNYSFSFGSGTLTVKPATLTVTAASFTIVYGQQIPTLKYAISGYQNGDKAEVVAGTPALTTNLNSQSPVGTYTISGTVGKLSAVNYVFEIANGQGTVSPAVLVITAANTVTTYGSQPAPLGYAMNGWVNGDTQAKATSGQPLISTTATKKSPVGTYAITAALGTLKAKNYLLQFKPGEMTVDRAMLAITANSLTMKAGAQVPSLTYSATGLMNGETLETAVLGSASVSTTATSKSKAGSYPITISKGTMKPANYLMTSENGTLTVTQ